MYKPRNNVTGKKFNMLTAIEIVNNSSHWYRWLCRCDCGRETVVNISDLTSGNTKSCGCSRSPLPFSESNFRDVLRMYKAAATRRNIYFSLSDTEFRLLTSGNCFYCGSAPSQIRSKNKTKGAYTYNGVDRKDNSVGYTTDNCVSCCFVCNSGKMAKTEDEFLSWIKRVYEFRRLDLL